MICKTCQEKGELSSVYVGAGMRTLLAVQSFYDPEGKYHVHDGNTTTTSYNCTNGHNWWESNKGSCWCGWPTEESS